MAKGYPLRKTSVQFYDGTATTPKTLDITGYASLPEFGDVKVRTNVEPRLDRGMISHIDYADDTLEQPEVSMTVDLVDTYLSTSNDKISEWFDEHSQDGTPLVSTNDGNAQARADDGTLKNIGIPTDIFTCGMKLTFNDITGAGTITRDYKYVQPVSVTISSETTGTKINFTVKLLGTYTTGA